MGMKLGAALAAALALAAAAAAATFHDSVRYVRAREAAGGGFAEPGGAPTPGLTAWAVLGLRAAGTPPAELERAGEYLEAAKPETTTDAALLALGLEALGRHPTTLLARLRAEETPSGRIGPGLNSTIWAVLAYRGAGEMAPAVTVRYLLARQHRSGGWSWHPAGAPDSNDTSAAVQALRAAGIGGVPIRRALAYLRRHQNRDGGFALTRGRASDAQSTAWAIQAILAAGQRPGKQAYRYLARLRRSDGSYRYSTRYATTPVWVTSQVLTALAGKPLPLTSR